MIVVNDLEHGKAVAKEAGSAFNPDSDVCICRVGDDGRLLGGVVYQNFTGRSIGMHVAGFDPKWINPDMLWVSFHYPFVQLGCDKVFGQVPDDNLKALDFDKKLGFKEVARIEGVFPTGDLILLRMLREECRWLKLKPRTIMQRAA